MDSDSGSSPPPETTASIGSIKSPRRHGRAPRGCPGLISTPADWPPPTGRPGGPPGSLLRLALAIFAPSSSSLTTAPSCCLRSSVPSCSHLWCCLCPCSPLPSAFSSQTPSRSRLLRDSAATVAPASTDDRRPRPLYIPHYQSPLFAPANQSNLYLYIRIQRRFLDRLQALVHPD